MRRAEQDASVMDERPRWEAEQIAVHEWREIERWSVGA